MPLQSDTLAKKAGGRDTARKRAILLMLEQHNEHDYSERGAPPYTAGQVADCVGGSRPSVSRTLRGMVAAGLLVAVRHRDDVWNAIAQNFIEKPVTAYYSARTMERDKVLAKTWADGAGERSAQAMDAMVKAFSR
ncbi:helix-turn-helix domain-containing protein [Aquitalea sp. USM4]|uniref:winged helix-turn-helix domain-containing protein n=1 Tax=Aquitalea sp. USM4 TaxID=1590041 RepID=UPI001038EF57|nr:helix-turn-helix domain-containing protein [Aquitalea sp. USM4]QBJ79574.1 hypothetical protein DKK66_16775 [Aquitalea sp. USM4]